MAKYLNPKAGLTFKKVFGEHKELLISFLTEIHENTKDAPAELATGALVTKDIPANEIWGGILARYIKKRDLE